MDSILTSYEVSIFAATSFLSQMIDDTSKGAANKSSSWVFSWMCDKNSATLEVLFDPCRPRQGWFRSREDAAFSHIFHLSLLHLILVKGLNPKAKAIWLRGRVQARNWFEFFRAFNVFSNPLYASQFSSCLWICLAALSECVHASIWIQIWQALRFPSLLPHHLCPRRLVTNLMGLLMRVYPEFFLCMSWGIAANL